LRREDRPAPAAPPNSHSRRRADITHGETKPCGRNNRESEVCAKRPLCHGVAYPMRGLRTFGVRFRRIIDAIWSLFAPFLPDLVEMPGDGPLADAEIGGDGRLRPALEDQLGNGKESKREETGNLGETTARHGFKARPHRPRVGGALTDSYPGENSFLVPRVDPLAPCPPRWTREHRETQPLAGRGPKDHFRGEAARPGPHS
jgi:hypothetical protein